MCSNSKIDFCENNNPRLYKLLHSKITNYFIVVRYLRG